jgi:His/Glu/Gln/Arg/opine family amino acid ABC transporter permease subunit
MGYLIDGDNWAWLGQGRNLRFLLDAFANNIIIALIAMTLSLILGLALALLRLSKSKWVSRLAGAWIDVWRNLPLIFILLYLFLALPRGVKRAYSEFVPEWLPDIFQLDFFLAAILGLTIYNSAVIAEIMRAGIVSLEKGQGEAASALGLPYWKAMRLVILPQGLRRMVPATVSQLITLTKDTSLTSIINIQEVVNAGQIVNQTAGNPFVDPGGADAPVLQVFIVVGAMFVIFNLTLSRISRRLEIRERKRTGTKVEPVTGLEDQVALEADVA